MEDFFLWKIEHFNRKLLIYNISIALSSGMSLTGYERRDPIE